MPRLNIFKNIHGSIWNRAGVARGAKYKIFCWYQSTPNRRGLLGSQLSSAQLHRTPYRPILAPAWRIHHNTTTTKLVVYHRLAKGIWSYWQRAGLLEYKYKLYLYIYLSMSICICDGCNISIYMKESSAQSPYLWSAWSTRTQCKHFAHALAALWPWVPSDTLLKTQAICGKLSSEYQIYFVLLPPLECAYITPQG